MAHSRGRPRHPDILTPAEWRVLEHIRLGRSNPEIAAELGLSVNTVRYHVSNILAKLELPDREAARTWDGKPSRRIAWTGPLPKISSAGATRLAVGAIAAAAVAIVAALGVGADRLSPTLVATAVPMPAAEVPDSATPDPPPASTAVPESVSLLQRIAPELVRMCTDPDEDTWPPTEGLPAGLGEGSHVIGGPHRLSDDGCVRTLPAPVMAERNGSVLPARFRDNLVSCWLWPTQVDPAVARLAITVEPVNPASGSDNDAAHRIVDPQPSQIVFANCGFAVADVHRFDNDSTRRWLPAE